jgi:hypothetical protein
MRTKQENGATCWNWLEKSNSGMIMIIKPAGKVNDTGFVHLQLLEYMVKIWRLYIKQHKKQPDYLPIVIPLLVCHARKEWPEDTERLASLLSGPVDNLTAYIPDLRQKLPGIFALMQALLK